MISQIEEGLHRIVYCHAVDYFLLPPWVPDRREGLASVPDSPVALALEHNLKFIPLIG